MSLITLQAFKLKADLKYKQGPQRIGTCCVRGPVAHLLKAADEKRSAAFRVMEVGGEKNCTAATMCYILCHVTSKFITLTHWPQLLWKTRMNQINIEEALSSSSLSAFRRRIRQEEKRG